MSTKNTDLLSRLPIREHWKNIKNILRILKEMDAVYFRMVVVIELMGAVKPYLELVLSAYILDGIGAGKSFVELMTVAGVALLLILVLHCIQDAMNHSLAVREVRIYYLYLSITQTRMLDMDFSRIAGPEIKELKDRINRDNNWGAGISSVLRPFRSLVNRCLQMVSAIVVGVPVVGYLVSSGRYEVLLVLAVLAVLVSVGHHFAIHFQKKLHVYRYSPIREEDKEEEFCFCWDFANGDRFAYQYGKDIRIYNSYSLMERWTTEVLGHKLFRRKTLDSVEGSAGLEGFSAMNHSVLNGAAYLIVAIIALGGTVTAGGVLKLAGALSGLFTAAYSILFQLTELALAARKQISTLELLDLADEMYKGRLPMEKRSDGQYQIEFKNVSFKYPGTENWALKDFSLKFKVGEKLAIVGMNGSGKTTMIKLLCRLYDPQEGEILLNGVDIRKFKQADYLSLFSVVFQDYVLFPFGLGENVAVDREYDRSKVEKCLKDADFGERFSALENGTDTYLYKEYDDSGVEISGGEAQKIAIARAVYKDAPFILLDEPTAALDPLAEYEIYSNFDKITGVKTAVYISHRLSSCRFCEKIAVFHEGRLVQLGKHEELVADKGGKYYEMWKAQAQYYREKGIKLAEV